MEPTRNYKLSELRPSAVILAAKFIKAGKDEWVTAGYVSHFISLNCNQRVERNDQWMHLVLIEALETPLYDTCRRV